MPYNHRSELPDSDQTARPKHPHAGDEQIDDVSPDTFDRQTSNKSGKHSAVEKLAAHRPEFGSSPGDHPVDGAFGDDPSHPITGRGAGPHTNEFRCNACGRYFNTASELKAHEGECRLAKAATPSGRESLRREDATKHPPDDAG